MWDTACAAELQTKKFGGRRLREAGRLYARQWLSGAALVLYSAKVHSTKVVALFTK
jgi:hypothetical protein